MKSKTTKQIVVSAIMIALSTGLSMIKVVQMPLGGSVTLLSMVPMCMLSVLYGVGNAIAPCILYGIIQVFLGGALGWGLSAWVLVGTILLDYVFAYTVLCFAGIFKNKGRMGIIFGVALSGFLRFLCHFLSGIILFRSFDVFNNPYIYSIAYNGAYMLPEIIITVIGVILLAKTTAIERMRNILGL